MSALLKPFAKVYQSIVHKRLAAVGLRYEDIIVHENPDLQAALKYIPQQEVIDRNRRLRRAVDLTLKHKTLPADVQAMQTPGKFYLADTMAVMKELRLEREALRYR